MNNNVSKTTAFPRHPDAPEFALEASHNLPAAAAGGGSRLQSSPAAGGRAISIHWLRRAFAANGNRRSHSATLPAETWYARPPRPLGGSGKRAMDIVIASVAIILLSPLLLMTMALIKVMMGGPVIFAHRRIGFNGRPFRCYKLRTMIDGAEESLNGHLASDPQAAREWREVRKLKDDPRITPLGQILRKSSLDELPQLFNILRGDMSCVGPRPIVADELPRYGPHAEEYMQARPGLTGLWQVSGRNSLDYSRRVALDCYYIHNWSVWTDLVIMSKTAFAMANTDDAA
jgi:exopolysaccharide production protein ExoY